MSLELVEDYVPKAKDMVPDSEPFNGDGYQKLINAVADAVVAKVVPELKKMFKDTEDDTVTQAQLNARYFHISAEAMCDLCNVPGFPKFYAPNKANARYSLEAVKQWTQEQKQTKKYI
ncbi:hypothetical protein [Loigolactobacillus bifermentans]|uniref:Uncharacterized protein n=1 Tax=Loigolactobacillus bifermentans DSM 20003 TaxID=1423726 RepID=A0A0R1GZ29_9LACO|nr:hypothetical protein [Loigolactobacillus bifermentans]KRK39001.1 hypothetical protein FC07_GL002718 [Loigolactobacillus bifermentans DSM 20003]QGG59112.1 hypothetical protein LB003_00790 [Loigolactobacillus bifermentans]